MGRETRAVFQTMETDLQKTKEHLRLKDEEMIRLAHETTDLNKKILQKDQELDNLRHYKVSNDSGNILQIELEQAKELIQKQKYKIMELEKTANHIGYVETPDESADELSTIEEGKFAAENEELMREIETLRQEKEELLKIINDFRQKVPVSNNKIDTTENGATENGTTQNTTSLRKIDELTDDSSTVSAIPLEEALEKLQNRFKRTMNEVAELTEEKHRLEHLVVQLQFETETIGEYITLYQNQRRQLKHKDYERDLQLKMLAQDREYMKSKLLELNSLIEQLLVEKRNRTVSHSVEDDEIPKMNGEEISTLKPLDESTESVFEPIQSTEKEKNPSIDKTNVQSKAKTKETARKILALLSDIQSANQIKFDQVSGVDHCACCSGKLEIV